MPRTVENPRLVLGSQLRKARETLALSPSEVAKHLNVTPSGILAWEQEQESPTLAQVERLAKIYGREIDYFLQHTSDPPAVYKYRAAPRESLSTLSVEARLAISRFEELCRKAVQIEQLLEKRRLVRLVYAEGDEPPPQLAARQREYLRFDGKPARGLRDALSRIGVRIFELPVPTGEFSGLSSPDGAYGPRILINGRDLFGRRHFTLAHELAHLLYRHEPSICHTVERVEGHSALERTADLFAVEILLPRAPLEEDIHRRGLTRKPSIQELGKLAGRWFVSVQAMGYRLEALKLIDRGHLRELLASYVERAPHRRGPRQPTWQRQLGSEYVGNALEAYRQGHISLGKLANCLGIPLRRAFDICQSGSMTRGR